MSYISFQIFVLSELLYQLSFLNFATKRKIQRDFNKNLVRVQCIQPLGWQHVTIFIGMKCTEFTIQ